LEGYDDYQKRESVVRMLIDLVSNGGNLLLNIGPAADGTNPVILQDRLIAMGEWLEVHGDAIYGTRKSSIPGQVWGRITGKGNKFFLHVFDWPEDHQLSVSGVKADHIKKAFLLHDDKPALKLLDLEMDFLLPSGLASHSIEA
jgi:alpha-L-fucosidase